MNAASFAFALVFVCACADAGTVGIVCPGGRCDDDGSRPVEAPEKDTDASAPATTQPGGRCADREIELTRRRLDIYMMIDDSASTFLAWTWDETKAAIDMFLRDPASIGVGVGLQFYGESCEAAVYSVPRVEIAPLPGNADRLMAAFPVIPLNESATLPALQGAIAYTKGWGVQHPGRDVAVLFTTDGFPEECESTVENVVQVFREANLGQASIRTHLIVLGPIGALNLLAAEGGTADTRLATPGSAADFLVAMNDVRDSSRSCTFNSPDGAPVPTGSLVVLREQADGARKTVPYVQDADRCDPQIGGYYLEGTSVALCSELCRALGPDRIIATWDCR